MENGEQASDLLISLGVDPVASVPDGTESQEGIGLVRTRSAQERSRREAAEVAQRTAKLDEEATQAELAIVQAELKLIRHDN